MTEFPYSDFSYFFEFYISIDLSLREKTNSVFVSCRSPLSRTQDNRSYTLKASGKTDKNFKRDSNDPNMKVSLRNLELPKQDQNLPTSRRSLIPVGQIAKKIKNPSNNAPNWQQ